MNTDQNKKVILFIVIVTLSIVSSIAAGHIIL